MIENIDYKYMEIAINNLGIPERRELINFGKMFNMNQINYLLTSRRVRSACLSTSRRKTTRNPRPPRPYPPRSGGHFRGQFGGNWHAPVRPCCGGNHKPMTYQIDANVPSRICGGIVSPSRPARPPGVILGIVAAMFYLPRGSRPGGGRDAETGLGVTLV